MRVVYRLRQFAAALTAQISPSERRWLAQLLPAAEFQLFERMPLWDQRHCLDVCLTLQRAGHADPLLLRAALLHDIGKVDDTGRPLPLVYYGIIVILRKLLPAVYFAAAASGRGPLRPFRLHAEHVRRSAVLLQAAGSPPALIALICASDAAQGSAQARLLRWADEQH